MLSIKNLTVTADNKKILQNINLDFDTNKIYAIMGTNGSGKSSLAKSIMGDPSMNISSGTISLNEQEITNMSPNERAHKGLFLSPQSPIAIPGVTVRQLLRNAIPRDTINSKDLLIKIKKVAKKLEITEELLSRSLNHNFSGGERKKMEVLQAAILNPQYIILDEIDTGVDVDALGIIAKFLKDMASTTQKTLILITHYNRILSYLPVDEVIVIKAGKVVQKGDASLAQTIESKGYEK